MEDKGSSSPVARGGAIGVHWPAPSLIAPHCADDSAALQGPGQCRRANANKRTASESLDPPELPQAQKRCTVSRADSTPSATAAEPRETLSCWSSMANESANGLLPAVPAHVGQLPLMDARPLSDDVFARKAFVRSIKLQCVASEPCVVAGATHFAVSEKDLSEAFNNRDNRVIAHGGDKVRVANKRRSHLEALRDRMLYTVEFRRNGAHKKTVAAVLPLAAEAGPQTLPCTVFVRDLLLQAPLQQQQQSTTAPPPAPAQPAFRPIAPKTQPVSSEPAATLNRKAGPTAATPGTRPTTTGQASAVWDPSSKGDAHVPLVHGPHDRASVESLRHDQAQRTRARLAPSVEVALATPLESDTSRLHQQLRGVPALALATQANGISPCTVNSASRDAQWASTTSVAAQVDDCLTVTLRPEESTATACVQQPTHEASETSNTRTAQAHEDSDDNSATSSVVQTPMPTHDNYWQVRTPVRNGESESIVSPLRVAVLATSNSDRRAPAQGDAEKERVEGAKISPNVRTSTSRLVPVPIPVIDLTLDDETPPLPSIASAVKHVVEEREDYDARVDELKSLAHPYAAGIGCALKREESVTGTAAAIFTDVEKASTIKTLPLPSLATLAEHVVKERVDELKSLAHPYAVDIGCGRKRDERGECVAGTAVIFIEVEKAATVEFVERRIRRKWPCAAVDGVEIQVFASATE